MSLEPASEAAFRVRLLTHPGERKEVDYKSSLPMGGDDEFSLKLLRHIQGMANAGGGWLVIGYAEGANGLAPDPSHNEGFCPTYDPTQLSQRVDSSVSRGQSLPVTVHFEPQPATRLRHPIIQIGGFKRLPYVCRSDKTATDTGNSILRQGAVYIRRQGAETAPVSTPQDWEEVIGLCMRLRRDELLGEFRELFERMTGSSPPPKGATEDLQAWIEGMRARRQ